MGLAALRRILEPGPCSLQSFSGHVVAVDANNLLWSFVTAMAASGQPPVGPDGRPIGHLIGLTNRLKLYADNGIRSAWVFDGPQPELKGATLAQRTQRIEQARAAGKVQAGTELTSPDIREAERLLSALGVPWMKAPGESDAQCAFFARTGQAWAAVTQDYDAALHGSPLTGRNLTTSTTRPCELIDLDAALSKADLTREQLVDASILIGTDYNDGIKGVGPVKAVKLVKKHGGLHGALEALEVEMPEADAVRALFLTHPVDEEARIEFRTPDATAAGELLEARGISARRAQETAEALARLHAIA